MYDLVFDLYLITLTLEFDLDMVKMYRHTKNEVSTLATPKFIVGAHTHRQTDRHYKHTAMFRIDAGGNERVYS